MMLSQLEKKELITIFKDLIKIKSVHPTPNESNVSCYLEKLFEKEGIPTQTRYKDVNRKNFKATLKGDNSKETILLLSHVDVVEAVGNWKYDAFSAFEDENGLIWGRGSLDTKHLTAMEIMVLLLLKRSGKKLNRDIVLLATADEESGSNFGMKFLAMEEDFIPKNALTVSEGGGFVIIEKGKKFRTCTCGEKGIYTINIKILKEEKEVNPFDVKNTLAYKYLDAVNCISAYESEEIFCTVTSEFKKLVSGDYLENKILNNLYEYCIKNDLQITGFNENFTDEKSEIDFDIIFKFIPLITKDYIQNKILSLTEKSKVEVTFKEFLEGYESDINSEFVNNLKAKANYFDNNSIFLPMLALGNTDGRFIKENVYGFSPMLEDLPFSEVLKKVHGVDECITIDSLVYGTEVLYSAIKEICFLEDK